MTTLAIHELTAESAELLPTRETLAFLSLKFFTITAVNAAAATNVLTIHSNAVATAVQSVHTS